MSRQVVISGLSGARRQRLHLEVAAAIERLYPEAMDEHYAELAQHFSRTSDSAEAVHYLGLAAVQASQRSAFAQAAKLARRGIAILAGVKEGPGRDREELGLQNLLAQMLATAFSPGSVEVERVLTRERFELCRRIGDETQLFLAVMSVAAAFSNQGGRASSARGQRAGARNGRTARSGHGEIWESPKHCRRLLCCGLAS